MSLNLDFISTEFNLRVVSNSEGNAYLFEGYQLDLQRRKPELWSLTLGRGG